MCDSLSIYTKYVYGGKLRICSIIFFRYIKFCLYNYKAFSETYQPLLVSLVDGERSFCKLKILEIILRSIITQQKCLSSVAGLMKIIGLKSINQILRGFKSYIYLWYIIQIYKIQSRLFDLVSAVLYWYDVYLTRENNKKKLEMFV